MALWVIRAGRYGDQQETALSQGVVCHGWNDLPDYSKYKTKDEFRALYEKVYPDQTEKRLSLGLGQTWRSAREVQVGDLVALPLKTEASIALGRVTGEYKYLKLAPNVCHVRPVKWLKSIERSAFPQDILFSLGSTLTVFQVTRNDAAVRVEQMLGALESPVSQSNVPIVQAPDEAPYDLAETARDQILKFIEQKFKKHDLARLVDAILRAQGYRTHVSPPGPDGGVDILAGRGALGFDPPRLSVQVKSGVGQEGQKTFNELLGVVSKFESEQGLFVSWSGFTNAVKADARKAYFKIRLWDQGQLIDSLLEVYEQLDDDIKAELPLKRVWVIAGEDTEPGE